MTDRYTSSNGHNSESIYTRVMVLALCKSSKVNICIKFHEDTLNGFQVRVQRFCDGQTDR